MMRAHARCLVVVQILGVLIGELLAGRVEAQIPNPDLLALPDGQWTELPDSAMAGAGPMRIPCCDFEIGCELPGILSFSGATHDPLGQRIVLWGGGHNDYFGNQLLLFDFATLRWQLETSPTSVCLFSDPPDYRFTDGTPVARHTYDHIDFIDHLGVFFAFSGASADSPPFNNGTSHGDLWTYDFTRRAWTDRTALQNGDLDYSLPGPGASGEYDPVSQRWYQISQHGIWSLDLANHRWTRVSDDGHPGIERVSVLDPVRRLIWTYGGDYGGEDNLSAYDIDANDFQIVSTDNLPGVASGAGLAYDEATDQLVLFGGQASTSVFNYDIGQGFWTEFPATDGPSANDRTYGRFLYDPTHNVFFLIASVDSVWVWKNNLGLAASIFSDGFESGDTASWSDTSP